MRVDERRSGGVSIAKREKIIAMKTLANAPKKTALTQ